MYDRITDKHRLFYVNNKLEFALFYDPKIIDKDLIVNTFLKSKDWELYMITYGLKNIIRTLISSDLKRVDITVK